MILILGSINEHLKTCFYSEYISGFVMENMIEEVNFSHRAEKTKKLPKNLKSLKI